MKRNIHIVVLSLFFSLMLKLTLTQNRQKRIETGHFGQNLSIFPRSPFHPPDEDGNTLNYKEIHVSNPNSKRVIPGKSPFSPQSDTDSPNSQLFVNFAPANSRLYVHNEDRNIQSRTPTSQNKHPSPRNVKKTRSSARKRMRSTYNGNNNRESPFQPQIKVEYKETGIVDSSKAPTGGDVRSNSFQRSPTRKRNNVRNPSREFRQIIERQRENTQNIPAISAIQVKTRHHQRQQEQQQQQRQQQQQQQHSQNPTSKSTRRMTVKPRVPGQGNTSYQNKARVLRDIHDVAPGVTPWTRYTDKPRVDEQRQLKDSSSYRGRCGKKQYNPRSQICCQGNILRRQGIQPSCCRSKTYDAIFKKCCNGDIHMLSAHTLGC